MVECIGMASIFFIAVLLDKVMVEMSAPQTVGL
jgi:hypothetical protein